MAITQYDEALTKKIEKLCKDTNIMVLKPEETSRLWQIKADMSGDKPLQMPLIAISRDTSIDVTQTNRRPMSFDGKMVKSFTRVEGNEEHQTVDKFIDGKTMQLDAIPITLGYQIDIYTREFATGDEYLREMLFALINHPKLIVEIPYNSGEIHDKIQHVANIRVQSPVNDNSDLKNKLFPDQFTRWTLKLVIDDAYLFSVPVKDNVFIDEEECNLDAKLND